MTGYDTSFKRYFMFGGVFCVLLVAVFANFMKEKIAFEKIENEAVKRFKKYKVYKKDVFLPQIQVAGPNGEMVNLLDGEHYTLLNIWATWCTPCITELPALRRVNLVLSFEKKWRVVAVSIDKTEDFEKVSALTKKMRIEGLADFIDINKQLQRSIKIEGLPMTLLLDKNGKILYEVYGDTLWYESNVVSLLRNIE